jgi:hypothetical protein
MVSALGVMAASPAARAQSDEVVDVLAGDERPWAEGVPDTRQDQAREVFAEANRSMKDGLFAQAAASYRSVLEIWDHAGAHYNLGLALISLDQPIEAYESFGKAMRHGPVPLQGQEKYDQAQRYREMLEKQLARIEAVCAEPGAEVNLNGQHVFTGPGRYEGMVRPGGHQIVATKAGRIPATEQAVLSPGELGRYELALALPASVTAERRWTAWKPWVVVGAGAIVMMGAGYIDYDTSRSFDSFDTEFDALCGNGCPDDEVPQALRDGLRRTERAQRVGQISYAIGGAALVTGVVLVYMNREQVVRRGGPAGYERAGRGSPRPVRALVFMPVLGPGQAGIQAALHF